MYHNTRIIANLSQTYRKHRVISELAAHFVLPLRRDLSNTFDSI